MKPIKNLIWMKEREKRGREKRGRGGWGTQFTITSLPSAHTATKTNTPSGGCPHRDFVDTQIPTHAHALTTSAMFLSVIMSFVAL